MANPHRGQVSLQAGDTTYTLSLSTNALCELEDHFGKGVTEIADMFQGSVSLKVVRGVVWASLQDHHPDIDLKGAGEVIDRAGMPRCMEAIGQAFRSAFPDSEKTGSHPRKARAG